MWPKWDQHEQAAAYAQTTLNEQTTCKTTVVTMVHNRSSPQHGLHLIIDVNRNNRYNKLLRLLAYVLRFVKNCRSPKTERYQGSLTVRELHTAEMKVIQNCQATAFHEEIHNMRSSSSPRLTLVKQLRLFLDAEGFVRCGGRIHNAPFDDQTQFPLLLPRRHSVTRLIIHTFMKINTMPE